MSERCGYDRPWQGPCTNPKPCEKHADEVCWCGAQATRGCSIASSFVCGNPTCDEHECNWVSHGMTGSPGNAHSPRGREQYKAWVKARQTPTEEPTDTDGEREP